MPKLIGIGGVFLFAQRTELLATWYQRHLGFAFEQIVRDDQSPTYYQELYYRDLLDSDQKRHTVFAIMPATHELSVPRNQTMINYQVDDLETLVHQLNSAGIACEPIQILRDAEGRGKFTHLSDPEGNRIELWEHLAGE